MKFTEIMILNEKLILPNKGAKTGQVLFLVGGGGSGKGYALNNMIRAENYKIINVDDIKNLIVQANIKNKPLSFVPKHHRNIKDLKDPENVAEIHAYVALDAKLDKKRLNTFKKSLEQTSTNKKELPNVCFDITLRDESKLYSIIPKLLDVGYTSKNIHIIWVVTDYDLAKKRNQERPRIVPDAVMATTHIGARIVMEDIIKGISKTIRKDFIDGEIYILLNNDWDVKFGYSKNYDKPSENLLKHQKQEGKSTVTDFTYFKVKDSGKGLNSSEVDKAMKFVEKYTPIDVKQSDVRKGKLK